MAQITGKAPETKISAGFDLAEFHILFKFITEHLPDPPLKTNR